MLSVGRNLGRPIWWMKPLICWCEWRRDLWSEGDDTTKGSIALLLSPSFYILGRALG